jgi:DNA-damage-inducible protein D
MSQTTDFESIKQTNPYGQEYWSARDLAPLLGYIQWRNFELAIKKAMKACSATDNPVEQHFADASKSSPMPHGGMREVKNYNLSRFACYLVAQNGDSRKPEIAAAQVYFAVSTRAHEIHQLLKEQEERLDTRLKVSDQPQVIA